MSLPSSSPAGRLRRRGQEDTNGGAIPVDELVALEKQEADLLDEKPHPRTPRTPLAKNPSASPKLHSARVGPQLHHQRGLSPSQHHRVPWINTPVVDFKKGAGWWKRTRLERFFQHIHNSLHPVIIMAAGTITGTYDPIKTDDNQKARGRPAWRQLNFWKVSCLVLILIILALVLLQRVQPTDLSGTSPLAVQGPSTWGGASWKKSVKKSCHRVSEETNMIVLVTGAAGFVGSHVSMALKKRGDGVVGLDNFNDYYPVALKRARQAHLFQTQKVFIVEGDLNDQPLLKELFLLVKFTHVLHLAAQAGVRYAVHNPLAYVHSNVAGFVTLMEACKEASFKPAIVYASSSSVYGLNTDVPFSESDRTDQPASLYAATKKADEVLGHTYNHIYGLSITALRFFTVYGPWGRPDMAYFSFTRNIMEEKPIKIFQGPKGEELARDFTFIDDVVKGCLGSLDTAEPSLASGKKGKAQFRTFNLGNTQPVKVGEFVGILEKHLKKKARRDYSPMPSTGDVMFTHANVSKAREAFNYEPTTDLDTGLKQFVKWYLQYYKEGSAGVKSLEGYKPY